MELTYIKVFVDYLDAIELLGDAERGRLFTALLEYGRTGVAPQLGGNERFLFPMMRAQIDREKSKVTSKDKRGANHWNWKGGITPKNQKERNSQEAHSWRKAVFERDEYTCQLCGQIGGKLNAHHIKPWATYKHLRYEISNGVTLCESCHRAEHRRNKQ